MTTSGIHVLVLGGSGMLGSMVVDVLSRSSGLSVTATVRSDLLQSAFSNGYPGVRWRVYDPSRGVPRDLFDGQHWAINAIGITKPLIRDDRADEIERAIEINARLPHLLAHAAVISGTEIIQIATDCVYSGVKGAYIESDPHDALDVYGKTKSLGETFQKNVRHLRCSIIGPEPKDFKFLIEWFRRQPKGAAVKGFINHRWNGVTTLHFARLCLGIIQRGGAPDHLVHVVPTGTITKAEMLHHFARVYQRTDVFIEDVVAGTVVDRTLATQQPDRNHALWKAAGFDPPPTVPQMISELAAFEYRTIGV